MSSPCLTGAGAGTTSPYSLDLDLLKSPSPSPSPSPLPSPSSTLCDITISTKKPRAPRKRLNQSYSEAAALLSAIHPGIFPSSTLPKLRHSLSFPFSESSNLLLPPPPNPPKLLLQSPKPNPSGTHSPTFSFSTSIHDDDDDFNPTSMLHEQISEGIDTILGNPSSTASIDSQPSCPYTICLNAYIASLIYHARALRRRDADGDWWSSPRVAVQDLIPKPRQSEKNKKKSNSNSSNSSPPSTTTRSATRSTTTTTTTTTKSREESITGGLNLKLNFEGVLKEWSPRGSPFGDSGASPESSGDVLTRLAHIDLFPETENGVRETSLQRYKEKRRNRLFSKKIRYEVRKVNADQRPRMKGRFVKRPALLCQTIEEESS
ncbi:protein CHLOROPLAST IMPORT APPARATUS 2 isoform X2 [Dioscorea cayenensis subsp. rotundata]|uniref:Protein CHLOROPLAST IMPORT APPARATUS 2 isoform X2 n=1 Tax=Dioscorea cayennensis subsp. rotundata TaxID=55577 RepID=A0AB40BUV7_DIOCR|nr:protein CHLOROPLAST IMPORT APPARATUS 2 isoform X2 [Dioscorea cayenensis subsp. rotundata]